MKLTKKQMRSFLIGTILGDSSMTGKKNKAIVTGHCESQYEYLEFKKELIESYCPVGATIKLKGNAGGFLRSEPFYQLYSTVHYKLTAIHSLIYRNNKKTIDNITLSKLDEVGIAALFMDDGCKETKKRKDGTRRIVAYKISMGSFSLEEINLFSLWIKNTYGIESKVYLEHRQYPCVKFTTEENRAKFKNLIEPFVLDSLKYKLYA